ncbi:hypothetical protein E2C01_041620 [Portunus trituberculatus]|uniref:Fibronectin type-III domain-containing protein n=1 Tax=Portunus trituberculatus TaxID=210409 RepID=A0A5B7FKF7_PORTR|nr:hypothetical protein [Portunus trituberculatus]
MASSGTSSTSLSTLASHSPLSCSRRHPLNPFLPASNLKRPKAPLSFLSCSPHPTVPETPISGREIDATETSVTIAWESANPDCSFKYEVGLV